MAAALGSIGGLWLAFEDQLIAEVLQNYRAPEWRRDLLQTRLEGYGWFSLIASGGFVAFAAVIRRSTPLAGAPGTPRTLSPALAPTP